MKKSLAAPKHGINVKIINNCKNCVNLITTSRNKEKPITYTPTEHKSGMNVASLLENQQVYTFYNSPNN